VSLPASLKRIGEHFLAGSSISCIDLSMCTELEASDDSFLLGAEQLRSVSLPASVRRIGKGIEEEPQSPGETQCEAAGGHTAMRRPRQ
jgi:hypothetical protein